MKLKKLLVMSVVALSILMVGCQKEVDSSDTVSTSSQSVLESVSVNTYHETMPVPVEGWTLELINEVIYINGKNISIPFTISDLGEGFEWETEGFFGESELKAGTISYNKELFLSVRFEKKNINEVDTAEITSFGCGFGKCKNLLYLNGIAQGSTYGDVIKAFGETDTPEDKDSFFEMYYYFDNYSLSFGISEGKVLGITLEEE